MKKTVLGSVCFGVAMAGFTAFAGGGTSTGSGGDPLQQEFVAFGKSGEQVLESSASDYPQIDFKKLLALLKVTSVEPTNDDLYGTDGLKKTAINLPVQQRIRFNIARWTLLASNDQAKLALATHEYLGLLGLDRAYEITSGVYHVTLSDVERTLEYGNLGKIQNGATYRSMTPYLCSVHVEADLNSRQIFLTFTATGDGDCADEGKTTTYQCESYDGINCPAIAGATTANYDPAGYEFMWKDDRLTVLPDGNLVKNAEACQTTSQNPTVCPDTADWIPFSVKYVQ